MVFLPPAAPSWRKREEREATVQKRRPETGSCAQIMRKYTVTVFSNQYSISLTLFCASVPAIGVVNNNISY